MLYGAHLIPMQSMYEITALADYVQWPMRMAHLRLLAYLDNTNTQLYLWINIMKYEYDDYN